MVATSVYEREFAFSEKDFKYIRELISDRTGIVLAEHKVDMVYGRLSRRLRELNLGSFNEYLSSLENDEQEIIHFVNALTTNLTAFYREPHHFEFLASQLLPSIIKNKSNKRLRIWSAGCSSGEEPYTIAMTVRSIIPENSGWDVKILATDLDSNMVKKGSDGIYNEDRVTGLSQQNMKKWVQKGRGETAGKVKMDSRLRDMITFKQLNLMNDWPMKGPFDLIFCRNVVIYFNKETQGILFNRYADMLVDDGHLFIGHSESMYKICDRFKLLGQTIYKRLS
ncbi:MAG: protein-glutamate O-methyltransferase CheR [Gammaproteobacteria bacterium]|nr:protein-glutamate O-methyltransferase CheR [Gammaproteobacteria bacterium]